MMSAYMKDREEHHSCKVDALLRQLPKDVRGIGEEVLHTIACGKKLLSWNKKLELVVDNRPISNTNIIELTQYILYPEDDDTDPPTGFERFVEELKRVGLEPQWVRNESVIKALENNENEWDTTDSESSDVEQDTEQSDGVEHDEQSDGREKSHLFIPWNEQESISETDEHSEMKDDGVDDDNISDSTDNDGVEEGRKLINLSWKN